MTGGREAEIAATALRDAATAARAEVLHGPADQYDWANWLERRAAVLAAQPETHTDREIAAAALREAADFCEATIASAMGSVDADYADGWRDASRLHVEELHTRADHIDDEGRTP